MPRYRFKCSQCEEEKVQFTPSNVEEIICEKCNSSMLRQLPITGSTQVKEIIDPYTNRKWNKDQTAQIKKRRDDHYWTVEVPRLINTHSLQTSLEKGWLKYNDKGELVINKPPSKR
jgi:ribosomal protein S27E